MVEINCISGYGDLMFCEPIFRHFYEQTGEKPIVYIHQHQMWTQQHIESAFFRPANECDFNGEDMLHSETKINLRYANQIFRGYGPHDHHDLENMMLDKYRLLGLPENLWKTLQLTFNPQRAVELTIEAFNGNALVEPYVVVNNNCQIGTIDIKPVTDHKIVYMNEISGFSLIDWYFVLKFAKEIHTVSTSVFYLLQAMQVECPVYIYPRPNEDGLRGISQLKPTYNYTLCQ